MLSHSWNFHSSWGELDWRGGQISVICTGMSNTSTIHIVTRDSAERGKLARLVFDSGFHAEIYANESELTGAAPRTGLGLVAGGEGGFYAERVLTRLKDAGQYLPLVAFGDDPGVPNVVRIIKRGALDYIRTPSSTAEIKAMVAKALPEADALRERRGYLHVAQARLSCLSNRERQVLDYLAQGYSNKMTARSLEISPRTVEIHRMKMMAKLGVGNIVEALRFRIVVESAATLMA